MIENRLALAEKAPPAARVNEIVSVMVRGRDGALVPTQIRRGELVRMAMSAKVAETTLWLAKDVHITESGRKIALDHQWRQIYADPACDMRIIAPAQRGKTLYQIVKTFAQLYLGMSVGWVMPKYHKIQELVNGKLNATIKSTPLYADLQAMSDGADTTQFKSFGEFGKLYLVTANSENELTSFSADGMHIDERDFCNRTNLPMYPSRMNASPYRLTDEISTPTIEGIETTKIGEPGNDNIHSEWLRGDQHRYFSRCPHCGVYQILDWFTHVVDVRRDDSGRVLAFNLRDQDWSPGSAQDIRVVCANKACGRPFDRLSPGVWKARRPKRRLRTYWVEALASAIGPSLETMLHTYQASLGNPSKMQHFHNMDLGRPFAGGMLRFTEELFRRCSVESHFSVSTSDGPCTCGIDVNRPWIDIQISKWVEGRQVKIWAGQINDSVESLVALLRQFGVVGGVIDTQPEHKFACELQDALASHGIILVRCKYATTDQAKLWVVSEKGENPELDPPRLVTVAKTMAVDALFGTMQRAEVTWFKDWKTIAEGSVLRDFTTPTRKLVVNEAGNERFVWEGKPDHQLHAGVYDMLAGTILGMNIIRDFSEIMPAVADYSHGGGPRLPPSGNPQRNDAVMIMRG